MAGRARKSVRDAGKPVKCDLMISLQTAEALGLEVPPSLLGRADEVIEQTSFFCCGGKFRIGSSDTTSIAA
jgi:hypothetical protein